MTEKTYQFRVTLKHIEPPIWRRIQVPESYTFWDFHVAIQDAMGWLDYHLHVFRFEDKKQRVSIEIGIPDPDGFDEGQVLPGWEEKISDYFAKSGDSCEYEYDFGDGWEHKIVLEKIIDNKKGDTLPKCVDGKRACPPEDCGGPFGYEDLLKIFADPKHERHQEMVDWLGEIHDPEKFDIGEVRFDNPRERFKKAFENGSV